MTPQLRRIVESEIRAQLERDGQRPRMLHEARIEHAPASDRSWLVLILGDGTRRRVELERFGRHYSGDARLFSQDCVRLYSMAYEDHLLELQLGASYQSVIRLAQAQADPDQVAAALQAHHELADHLRRHHRVRRDHPLMPVEPYHATRGPDLALESMQRAMQAMMHIPAERLRLMASDYYEFGGVGIVGIDWAADAKVENRALALLKERLSPAQRAQYEAKQHFEVVGGASGKRYRIRHGRQMNIDELDAQGAKVCGWCFLPQGGLAAGDVMLAQKIALECDEMAALKVASRFGTQGVMGLGLLSSLEMRGWF